METLSARPKSACRKIPLDRIIINREESLRGGEMDEDALNGLQETIDEFGVLQSVIVTHTREGTYELVAGERRYRDAKRLNMETIPAIIYDNLSAKEVLSMKLVENMQRVDLRPLEEAHGMADLLHLYGYTIDGIAKKLGKSSEFVQRRLALLDLHPLVQNMLAEDRIGVTHAENLTKLNSKPEKQLEIAEDIERRKLSADIVERMVEEEISEKRHYKKMTRKHKLKRSGEPLSEDFMEKKIMQVASKCGELMNMLDAIPLKRWSPEKARELSASLQHSISLLQVFVNRADIRGRQKE